MGALIQTEPARGYVSDAKILTPLERPQRTAKTRRVRKIRAEWIQVAEGRISVAAQHLSIAAKAQGRALPPAVPATKMDLSLKRVLGVVVRMFVSNNKGIDSVAALKSARRFAKLLAFVCCGVVCFSFFEARLSSSYEGSFARC